MKSLGIKIIHQRKQDKEWDEKESFVWTVVWQNKGLWSKDFDKFDDSVNFVKRLVE